MGFCFWNEVRATESESQQQQQQQQLQQQQQQSRRQSTSAEQHLRQTTPRREGEESNSLASDDKYGNGNSNSNNNNDNQYGNSHTLPKVARNTAQGREYIRQQQQQVEEEPVDSSSSGYASRRQERRVKQQQLEQQQQQQQLQQQQQPQQQQQQQQQQQHLQLQSRTSHSKSRTPRHSFSEEVDIKSASSSSSSSPPKKLSKQSPQQEEAVVEEEEEQVFIGPLKPEKSPSKSPVREKYQDSRSKSPPQVLTKSLTPGKGSSTSLHSTNSGFNDTDKHSQSPQPRPIEKQSSPLQPLTKSASKSPLKETKSTSKSPPAGRKKKYSKSKSKSKSPPKEKKSSSPPKEKTPTNTEVFEKVLVASDSNTEFTPTLTATDSESVVSDVEAERKTKPRGLKTNRFKDFQSKYRQRRGEANETNFHELQSTNTNIVTVNPTAPAAPSDIASKYTRRVKRLSGEYARAPLIAPDGGETSLTGSLNEQFTETPLTESLRDSLKEETSEGVTAIVATAQVQTSLSPEVAAEVFAKQDYVAGQTTILDETVSVKHSTEEKSFDTSELDPEKQRELEERISEFRDTIAEAGDSAGPLPSDTDTDTMSYARRVRSQYYRQISNNVNKPPTSTAPSRSTGYYKDESGRDRIGDSSADEATTKRVIIEKLDVDNSYERRLRRHMSQMPESDLDEQNLIRVVSRATSLTLPDPRNLARYNRRKRREEHNSIA